VTGVLFFGVIVSIIVVFDVLVAAFGVDTRPDFGGGQTILS